MLKDAAAKVLITDVEHRASVRADVDGPVVCVDADAAAIAQRERGNLPPADAPSNLAYVMYTSGLDRPAQGRDGRPSRAL